VQTYRVVHYIDQRVSSFKGPNPLSWASSSGVVLPISHGERLIREILQKGTQLADEHIALLERWLTEHILTADMRLGSFLAEAM